MGMIVTNMILEHTLYPPRVIIPLSEQLLNFISNHKNSSTSPPANPNPSTDRRTTVMVPDEPETLPTVVPTKDLQFDRLPKPKPLDLRCGLTSDSNPVIANGEAVSPTMWPWLAAVFIMKDELEFKCNGNLISRQFVLTGIKLQKIINQWSSNFMKCIFSGSLFERGSREYTTQHVASIAWPFQFVRLARTGLCKRRRSRVQCASRLRESSEC